MAEILTELHLYDQDSLVASILYRAVREGRLDIESVQEQFGESVTTLIEGVRKMAVISTLRADGDGDVFGHVAAQQATKVREMLVSIIDDVRVALIKIAERTCAIRCSENSVPTRNVCVWLGKFSMSTHLWLIGWVSAS